MIREIKQNLAFQRDFSRLRKIEAELREKLPNDEKMLFNEYMILWSEICVHIDFDSYKTGFRHGAAFAADALNTENN